MHQQHEACEGDADAPPTLPEKKPRAPPIIGRRHEVSSEQKHQSHAKRRIGGIERGEPLALCAIMYGPKTASGSIGLGGVMNNDEDDGRNTQRVDEDQPLLVLLVSVQCHAMSLRALNEGAFILPAGRKGALMHIKLKHAVRSASRLLPRAPSGHARP